MKIANKTLIPYSEVLKILNISKMTAYRWELSGKITFQRAGHKILGIWEDELVQILDEDYGIK